MANNSRKITPTLLNHKKDKAFDILAIEHEDLGVAGVRYYDLNNSNGIWVLSAPNRWGKSTLVKAMKVALFGSKSFERQTPSLIYDLKEYATISLEFRDLRTSDHYKLIRKIKKNTMESKLVNLSNGREIESWNDYTDLEPTEVDLMVYELFGVGAFRLSDIMSSYFFDITKYMLPEAMIESFSKTTNMLYELRSYMKDCITYGLEELKEYDRRERERNSIRARLDNLQSDINEKSREVDRLATTLASLKEQASKSMSEIDKLTGIKTSLDPLYEKMELIARDIEEIVRQKERSEARLNELKTKRTQLKEQKERLENILTNSELLNKMHQLYEEQNQILESIGENQGIIEELKPYIIEVIGDNEPFEHAEDILSVNKVELNARINILLEESEEHRKELEMLDLALNFMERYQKEKVCPICETKNIEVNSIETRRQELSKRVDSITIERERLQKRRDSRESLLKKLKTIKSAEENLKQLKSTLERINERIEQEQQKLDDAGISFTQEELDASARHIDVIARLHEIEGMLKEQERLYEEIVQRYDEGKIPEKERQLAELMEEYRSKKGEYENIDIRLSSAREELSNVELQIKNKAELHAPIQTELANLRGMQKELKNNLDDLIKKEYRNKEQMETALKTVNFLDELFQDTIDYIQRETQQRITQTVDEKTTKFDLPIKSITFEIKDGKVDDLRVERTVGPPELSSLSLSEMVQTAYSIDSAAHILEEAFCNLVILDNTGDLDTVRLDQILEDIIERGIKKIIVITVNAEVDEKKLFQWYPLTYKFDSAGT